MLYQLEKLSLKDVRGLITLKMNGLNYMTALSVL